MPKMAKMIQYNGERAMLLRLACTVPIASARPASGMTRPSTPSTHCPTSCGLSRSQIDGMPSTRMMHASTYSACRQPKWATNTDMSGAKIRPPKPAPELTKPITMPRLLMNHLCTTVVAGMKPMNASATLNATPNTRPNSTGLLTVPVSAVNAAVNTVPNMTIGRTP